MPNFENEGGGTRKRPRVVSETDSDDDDTQTEDEDIFEGKNSNDGEVLLTTEPNAPDEVTNLDEDAQEAAKVETENQVTNNRIAAENRKQIEEQEAVKNTTNVAVPSPTAPIVSTVESAANTINEIPATQSAPTAPVDQQNAAPVTQQNTAAKNNPPASSPSFETSKKSSLQAQAIRKEILAAHAERLEGQYKKGKFFDKDDLLVFEDIVEKTGKKKSIGAMVMRKSSFTQPRQLGVRIVDANKIDNQLLVDQIKVFPNAKCTFETAKDLMRRAGPEGAGLLKFEGNDWHKEADKKAELEVVRQEVMKQQNPVVQLSDNPADTSAKHKPPTASN